MYVCNYEQLVEICSQLYTYICKPVSSEHRLFLMNNRQLVDLDSEKEVSTRKRTGVKNTVFGKLTQKLHRIYATKFNCSKSISVDQVF